MQKSVVFHSALWEGLSPEDIKKFLVCLKAREETFQKGDTVLRAGSLVMETALVLTGRVQIENVDAHGNRSLMAVAGAGELIAGLYAALPAQPLLSDMIASTPCRILFISSAALLSPCERDCLFHQRVLLNLMRMIAADALRLSHRLLDISPKTIRGRLLSYFARETYLQGSTVITVPFDRQQMADYFNLDRSALSHELSKMKRDGLIDYHKNSFAILSDFEEN